MISKQEKQVSMGILYTSIKNAEQCIKSHQDEFHKFVSSLDFFERGSKKTSLHMNIRDLQRLLDATDDKQIMKLKQLLEAFESNNRIWEAL